MRKILTSILFIAALPAVSCLAVSSSVTLVNSPAIAYSSANAVNLFNFSTSGGIASKLAYQVTFSSANPASQSFTGGNVSTGSITVVSTQALIATYATDTLTVPTTNQILGSPATGYITVISTIGMLGTPATFTTTLTNFPGIQASSPSLVLNGYLTYTWGSNWVSTDTISHAATTLSNAINAGGTFGSYPSVGSSTQVVISYLSSGTFSNGFIVTSSSYPDVSSGTFSGGRNPTFVTIGNANQSFVYTYGANWVSSANVTGAAANLVTAMSGVGGIVSTNVAGVAYSTLTTVGAFGNAYTMATSSSPLVSVSSSNFSGGLDPFLRRGYFTIGGTKYTNGYGWSDVSGTSTGTCSSIATFLNNTSTNVVVVAGGYGNVTAVCNGINLVTLTSGLTGSAANTLTLAASPGFLVGSANFTGGQDNAYFTIGSLTFAYPANWNLGASSTTLSTSQSIAASINSNPATTFLIIATNTPTGIVPATGTVNGVNTNYAMTSSTPTALNVVGFTGATNPAYSSGTAIINIATHNFTTDMAVIYSTSNGVSVNGLTNQTTYYVIVIDSNDIALSSTSAVALSGVGIVYGSTDTALTAHSYTLKPLSFTQGSASGGLQVSNDNTNWMSLNSTVFNVSVSSNIFTPVYPSSTTGQDLGMVDYQYIRYNVTPPTQGSVAVKVILSSKD